MSDPVAQMPETRVLVLAPTGRDAELIESVLEKAGFAGKLCADMPSLCRELTAGAGAALLAEEALLERDWERALLVKFLAEQPPWSDLPLLVLTHPGADSPAALQAMADLGNVTLLERPLRVAAFVSGVRSALRARQRQYQIQSYLAQVQGAAETRALLAAIVTSSNDAIISKTLDGVIMTWNVGAERLFEYSAEEAIGRPITMIIPPDRLAEEERILQQLRRGLRIHDYETVRAAKSGHLVDVSVSISPLRDEDGRIIGGSKVARDISARKRVDAALKDADRRKDEFLATLAHELRNPLAPIRNSLETMALAKSQDPIVERAREIMSRQVDHMVRLVDDLLEVSRIERGKIELRSEIVELSRVLAMAIETSGPLIDAGGHELILAGPRAGLKVDADPIRLSQVFANLLNNSAKYTEPGGKIWLSVREQGPLAVISVRDTGIGIAAGMLPNVFEMFSQEHRSQRRAQDGLGIGLSLVRRLVEMHGGTVEAWSDGIGRGSEFTVRLPVASGDSRERASRRQKGFGKSLAPLSVLVADDNQDAADSLGTLLRSMGADVRVVYDGVSALAALEAERPDVALLDIGMPLMDGYELARRIRERSDAGEIVLIALTGWGQVDDKQRALEAGFDHHVGKPADVTELHALMLSLRRAPDSAAAS
jgi:PAS domain S-box-containing protein